MADPFVLTAHHSLAHHIAEGDAPTAAQLADYAAQDRRARQFPTDAKLVLDTNVLLRYYQLPLAERRRLYAFLEREQRRVYVSEQVVREFDRHADALRQQQRKAVQWKRPTSAQAALPEQVAAYLRHHAALLRPYPQLYADWQATLAHSRTWLQQLQRYAATQVARGRQLLAERDLAELLPTFQRLPALSKREYQRLKPQLRALAARVRAEQHRGFDDSAAAFAYRYPGRVFPGLGDALVKVDEGIGDYVLYHELLKWVATDPDEATHLLLTLDSSKGDWMTLGHTPYALYHHHFATRAGRLVHLLPAESWLAEHAGVDTTPLLTSAEVWADVQRGLWAGAALTSSTLRSTLGRLYPHRSVPEAADWDALLEELDAERSIRTEAHLYALLLDRYPKLLAREQQLHHIHDRCAALRLTLDLRG